MLIQTLITDYFFHIKKIINLTQTIKISQRKKRKYNYYDNNIDKKKIYGYNSLTFCWHCLECGINMGSSNSRQLCGKYYCNNTF
jgi:hypothetical protein